MTSSPALSPARPAAPPAAYIGGKRNLARGIIARIQAIPHQTYVEPFIGMGGVFLRRPFRAQSEVINDLSLDVATLFRVLQWHYVPLMDMLRWQLTSRQQFDWLLAATPESLTDLQRAARFLYLQRTSFGGRLRSRSFGVSPGTGARFDVNRLGPILEEVHSRLSGVVIERLPWPELLARYDRSGTLFYLDPPYWGNEADYGAGTFSADDFGRMADALAGLRGRFLLSLNDVPPVREIFGRFQIEAMKTTYSVSSGAPQPAREVVISGGGGR